MLITVKYHGRYFTLFDYDHVTGRAIIRDDEGELMEVDESRLEYV